MKDLSIIIVSYKGWTRLTRCLESLNTFAGKSFNTEVIVVDNRSDDETIYQIEKKFPGFRFIHNRINAGFTKGCNLGARNSNGKFLLFLNPDTVASEPEIEKLLTRAKESSDDFIHSCRQVNEKGKESIASGQFPDFFNLTGFQRTIVKLLKSVYNSGESEEDADVQYPDWVSGSVIMIKKEIFQKLNGFDEDFWMYYEDVDLCRRARNIGVIASFYNNINIEHNHGGSSRTSMKTTALTKTEVHISKHVYISKHTRGIERIIIQAFLVINNIISGGLMALIGLLLFAIPKLYARTLIYIMLLNYYSGSIFRLSWISPNSVNFRHN